MDSHKDNNELRALERHHLRKFERDASEGLKLRSRDRLMAAFHLTRAWNAANATGLRKEDYQDQILSALTRKHKSRQEFRLSNWTLRRGEDPRAEDLRPLYQARSTPQRALEPYLVGIMIAAQRCDEDPDLWKLNMMRDLSIWGQRKAGAEVQPADDRAAETLAMLISALCSAIGRRNRLQDVFDAIAGMNCRWEMYGDKLLASDSACMQLWAGPVTGQGDYFEEAFPFPSVSLVRVPYLQGNTSFVLAPEAAICASDETSAVIASLFELSRTIPDEIPGRIELQGQLGWYRDVRLCVLPDDRGGFLSGLETRPYLEVRFEGDHHLAGVRTVVGGYEPGLSRPLFYARSVEGHVIWPHVRADDGEIWQICNAEEFTSEGLPAEKWTERDPETTGWEFDTDPIGAPGQVFSEPWYLSYTPATPDYLRHWLTNSWQLGDLSAQCDWSRGEAGMDWDQPDSRWNRNLPPIWQLNFPDLSNATWVECCLHNGLIEEALQNSIDWLKSQVAELQADWQSARDRNAQALLARWHPSRDPNSQR